MRRALGDDRGGRPDARVQVDDGSEVGLLQCGFNAMAAGLEERERLRDLFGRHVGEDVVAGGAGDGDGPALGGEVRDVARAVRRPRRLDGAGRRAPAARGRRGSSTTSSRVVVEVAARHGGWVNKFEGDAALVRLRRADRPPRRRGAALRAARELHDAAATAARCDAGIGVSAGPAVAGNVGAEQRFEYTVIGDPVNEAARLCELAKRRDDRVLASGDRARRSAQRRAPPLAGLRRGRPARPDEADPHRRASRRARRVG